MSSLEERLASASASMDRVTQEVADFFGTQKPRIDDRMDAVDAALRRLPDAMRPEFSVDAINGDDDNDGSQDAPFKTLIKAINGAPDGGFTTIRLLSDVELTVTRANLPANGSVQILGIGGYRTLRLPLLEYVGGGPYDLEMAGFYALVSTSLSMRTVRLELPARPDAGQSILENTQSAVIGTGGLVGPGFIDLDLHGCQVTLPPVSVGVMVGASAGSVSLKVSSTSFPASLAGRWVTGIGAGTDPAGVSRVITNLSAL